MSNTTDGSKAKQSLEAFKARVFQEDGIALDEEVVLLCAMLNELPGLQTTSSCSGHGKHNMRICLVASSPSGVAWLARLNREAALMRPVPGHKYKGWQSFIVRLSSVFEDDIPGYWYELESVCPNAEIYATKLVANLGRTIEDEIFLKGLDLERPQGYQWKVLADYARKQMDA